MGEALNALYEKYPNYQGEVAGLVKWAEWAQNVVSDGVQVANAVEQNPHICVEYFSKPPVQRGAIAYAKYCYSLPR